MNKMIWQDIIVALANILFTYSLIFQVYHGFKVKKTTIAKQTSLFTAIGLFAAGISFLTLKMYMSGIIVTFDAFLWIVLFIQKITFK